MTEIPVFEPVKPVGKCGACQRDLYAHMLPTFDCRNDCPMWGDEWQQRRRMEQMRNVRIGAQP